ncbi:unnamed protein product [Trichogramma brassicae]|uniref:Uncharacterized protein n=1 Tax=Trichogramma brassicae TaxID=86971 RepID=A0A6H5ITK5_9HYME|nr:unnamed protein product [Trichogramma brassicae]
MPNTGGPRSSQRELYAHVVDSIFLYGAPIWSCATETQAYIRQAESLHRRACLRVISGRPHVSYDVSYVRAGVPPLALLADERARIHQHRPEDAKEEERRETLSKWQAPMVEPGSEEDRVPLKKKTQDMSSASKAGKKPRSLRELEAKRIIISRSPRCHSDIESTAQLRVCLLLRGASAEGRTYGAETEGEVSLAEHTLMMRALVGYTRCGDDHVLQLLRSATTYSRACRASTVLLYRCRK